MNKVIQVTSSFIWPLDSIGPGLNFLIRTQRFQARCPMLGNGWKPKAPGPQWCGKVFISQLNFFDTVEPKTLPKTCKNPSLQSLVCMNSEFSFLSKLLCVYL